jgi:hypothetical protein
VIWDRSATDCLLTSPILASGLDKAGRPVTETLSYPVQAPALLTAHEIDPGDHRQFSAGEGVVSLIVAAAYLHDGRSHSAPCTGHELEPASWRLTLASGGLLTVPNMDPLDAGEHGRGLPVDHGLLTCRGELESPKPAAVAS